MTTKPPHDLETALRTTEPLVLSTEERREMKEQLLAHATFHTKNTSRNTPVRTYGMFWRTSLAGAVAMLIVVTTGANAYSSLPGELLYPMKVNVIEPIALPLTYPGISDLSAHTLRLERRLGEIKTLQQEGALSTAATSDVINSVTEHSDALISALADPTSTASDAETLHSLDTASALIEAHETLLASSSEATAALLSIEQTLEATYEETVEDIATGNASSSLATYIDASLDSIEAELVTSDLPSSTVEIIETYLDTASSSLTEADYVVAQEAVSEARQIILTDDYIEIQQENTSE